MPNSRTLGRLLVAHFDPHELLCASARYFIGRSTLSTNAFAETLAEVWACLPKWTQGVIRRDLEEAFRGDDIARDAGRAGYYLGQDCDRAAWEKVRQAWIKESTKE